MVPLFVVMLSGAVDVSKIYIDQSNAHFTARDTARLVARHAMDEDGAESHALDRVAEFANGTGTADVEVSGSSVTVTVTAPVSMLAKFGFLSDLDLTRVTASVTHAMEPI